MKKKLIILIACAAISVLTISAVAACTDPSTYTVEWFPSEQYTVDCPVTEAETGDTIRFTVAPANGVTLTGVYANGIPCEFDGTYYYFAMPEGGAIITVQTSPVSAGGDGGDGGSETYTEVLVSGDLSWRSDTPDEMPTAETGDEYATYRLYFDFAESKYLSGDSVTLTSLTTDVLPQEALGEVSLWSDNMGNRYAYGYFDVDLLTANPGTAYISVHVDADMGGTSIDDTIVKKIDIVPYSEFTSEVWTETVTVNIPDWADYEGLTIQVSNDTMWKYGLSADIYTVEVTGETTVIEAEYLPKGGGLGITVYYDNPNYGEPGESQLSFIELPEVVGEGSTATDLVRFDGSYAYFPLPNGSIEITAN